MARQVWMGTTFAGTDFGSLFECQVPHNVCNPSSQKLEALCSLLTSKGIAKTLVEKGQRGSEERRWDRKERRRKKMAGEERHTIDTLKTEKEL